MRISSAGFSYDGSKIVLSGLFNEGYNLFLIETSDQDFIPLTQGKTITAVDNSIDEAGYSEPAFTHDGKAIVCTRIAPSPPWAPESRDICAVDIESRTMGVLRAASIGARGLFATRLDPREFDTISA